MFSEAFDAVYVINLIDRLDRRHEIKEQLDRIWPGTSSAVTFFRAVRPVDPGGFPSIGARGCFLSHLGILEDAASRGYVRILILEDDCDFTRVLKSQLGEFCREVGSGDWAMLYGGGVDRCGRPKDTALRFRHLDPAVPIQGTHFVAFKGESIARAVEYLQAMLSRPPGDPLGGPMHVDGAYSWFRRENPDLVTKIAVPQIAYQRASKTDIHHSRFWDRFVWTSKIAGFTRLLKNRLHRLF